jgi:N-acyl-D-amino-acid deacylase
MSELLVRGGTVLDGTGAPGVRADVRIVDRLIREVGPNLAQGDADVLDAGGALVTPGFIDLHTHLDPALFWDPLVDPMPQHGVTTILTGNCSLSLAPMRQHDRRSFSSFFSFVEDIPEDAFHEHVPWTWTTWSEYLAAMRPGHALSVAGLVGHTPLRIFVMGHEAWERAANESERQAIAALLDDCLGAGAFGFSTSFFDTDISGRPAPPRVADDAEFEALFDVVGRHRALVQFVPEWMGGDPQASVERMARLARGRDLTLTWTGLAHKPATDARNLAMLDRTQELRMSGVRINSQYSPRPHDAQVNWDRTIAFVGMPRGWQQVISRRGDDKIRLLADPSWRQTAREEWDAAPLGISSMQFFEKTLVTSVGRADLQRWVGRSLDDLVAERGGHRSDVLADWLIDNRLETGIVVRGYSNSDADGVSRFLRHPANIIGASDAGAHVAMTCCFGDSTLILAHHVRDRGDLTLESAVSQMTGQAADMLGLADRGRVEPGGVADLAVFALDELRWLPEESAQDLPSGGARFRRPSGGYRYVMANGVVTSAEGRATGARPGGPLVRSLGEWAK